MLPESKSMETSELERTQKIPVSFRKWRKQKQKQKALRLTLRIKHEMRQEQFVSMVRAYYTCPITLTKI